MALLRAYDSEAGSCHVALLRRGEYDCAPRLADLEAHRGPTARQCLLYRRLESFPYLELCGIGEPDRRRVRNMANVLGLENHFGTPRPSFEQICAEFARLKQIDEGYDKLEDLRFLRPHLAR